MKFFLVFPYYLYWHYTKGLKELMYNFWSIVLFQIHFFSVKDLFFTMFAPYKRLKEDYSGNGLNIEAMLSSFVVNIIMRIIGFLIRAFILSIAFITLACSIILYPVFLCVWILLPFALISFIGVSIWAYITYAI